MIIPFVDQDRSINFEVKDKGRLLVLKEARFSPETNCYHDIRLLRRGWTLMGVDLGGGGTWTGVTEDAIRNIQMTYGIVLKTLNAKPGQVKILSQPTETTFLTKKEPHWMGLKRDARNISYPFGKKKNDLLLSKEDAALYGSLQMTLHDAVNSGIWNAMCGNREFDPSLLKDKKDNGPMGLRKEQTLEVGSPEEKRTHLPRKKPGLSLSSNEPVATFPHIPAYRVKSTPTEPGYDTAPFVERKRRVVEHLNRSAPLPFHAFITQNKDHQIESALFRRMLNALRELAKNPMPRSEDEKYMYRLLKHWFRAAYYYLEKNSEPGDGYEELLRQSLEKTKDVGKARAKAKELYWRREATFFWMTLISLFSSERINIDLLHQMISKETSLKTFCF